MLKIRDNNFIERSILRLGVFGLRLPSKRCILKAFKHLPLFLPNMAAHDVTKTLFSQKSRANFYEILADVKLTTNKVLKVSRRYLTPFLSYRENPTGWAEPDPLPSGAQAFLGYGSRRASHELQRTEFGFMKFIQ